ncbi:MAG: cAMP-activated global transcriptional regulator CRP [Chromatiales bacterium]|nr:cAMP-activated global transcriptional regulator CRP [Chromatiales bacterium]
MAIVTPVDPKPFVGPLLAYCHRKNYPAKTDIIRPGDPPDTLYYIVDGSVTVIIEDEDGNELVLAYLNAGDFIGEMGLFSKQDSRGALVRTRVKSEIAEISYRKLLQLFDSGLREVREDLLFAIGAQLTKRLLETSRKVRDLAFVDVSGRVARTLLQLSKQPDAITHPEGMQIRITRQELARIVGCSREMVGRVLKNLEGDGMVACSGKTMVVRTRRTDED